MAKNQPPESEFEEGPEIFLGVGKDAFKTVAQRGYRGVIPAIVGFNTNSRDAGAHVIHNNHRVSDNTFTIRDDGKGMLPEELNNFTRTGDSVKLENREVPGSPGERTSGHFNFETKVLPVLCRNYTVVTRKEGWESIFSVDCNKALNSQFKASLGGSKKRRVSDKLHGTELIMEGLRASEWNSFTLRELRHALQVSFRRLTLLPDFKFYVNDEPIEPAVFSGTKIPVQETIEGFGEIAGNIYISPAKNEMFGVHISVNGRTCGEPVALFHKYAGIHHSTEGRVVCDLKADGLEDAVLLDRGEWNTSHPGFVAAMNALAPYFSNVRTLAENDSANRKSKAIVTQLGSFALGAVSTVTNSDKLGIPKRTKATVKDHTAFNMSANEPSSIYLPGRGEIVFNRDHPILAITPEVKGADLRARLTYAATEAVLLERLRRENPSLVDLIVNFLGERDQAIAGRPVVKTKSNDSKIEPFVAYSNSDLSRLSGIKLGAIRYMRAGEYFPTVNAEINGRNFVSSIKKVNGLLDLYSFVAQSVGEEPSEVNRLLEKYGQAIPKMGNFAKPFFLNYAGKTGRPCYFVEGTAVSALTDLLNSPQFDLRRNGAEVNIFSAMQKFGERVLTIDQIEQISDGLDKSGIMGVLNSQVARSLLGGQSKGKYQYSTFVNAMQAMRGNR